MTPKHRSWCYMVSFLWQFKYRSIAPRLLHNISFYFYISPISCTSPPRGSVTLTSCCAHSALCFPLLCTWTPEQKKKKKPTRPVFQAQRLQTHPELTVCPACMFTDASGDAEVTGWFRLWSNTKLIRRLIDFIGVGRCDNVFMDKTVK